ncbi:MAG: prolyl oligopeptidase family serine peptidase [Corynebacterium sp.]|nr:prolyl oligopeptidase family serine peptidase [Corynebacterium sp.]
MNAVPPSIHPVIDAALTRWERHARPGLPDHGFALGRAEHRQRRGVYDVATDRSVFETEDHILTMSPSPDRVHIAMQLAERADEDAHLAVLDTASGRLRRFTDVRCRYDPMLWRADASALELFARPSSSHIVYRPRSGDVCVSVTPEAATSRLFPGGAAGLVAISRPGGVTRLIDHSTGRQIGQLPAVTRVAALTDAVVVDDGRRLQAMGLEHGDVLWTWEDPEAKITSWTIAGSRVVATAVRAGASVVFELDQGHVVTERSVVFRGEPAVATGIAVDAGRVAVMVEGPTTPPRVLSLDDVHDAPHQRRLAAASAPVRTLRHVARADDGVQISVVVTGPGPDRGPGPLILTCYGGFGVPALPIFEPSVPAWAEAGGGYAIAQVRGGGERGAAWRDAGRGDRKHQAIADLAAAARSLIDSGYTRPDQLVLVGASHGGVIATSCGLGHPELCAGIVSTAAPLDLLNLDAHPLGRHWIAEFGTSDTSQGRERLRAISPLHRAQALAACSGPLPRFLGVVMDEDSRVSAADTRRVIEALLDAGADAAIWHAPRTGHGTNHLDRVHDFAAAVLSFAASTTGLLTRHTEKADRSS